MNPITSTLLGIVAAGAMTAGAISVATNAATSASPTLSHGAASADHELSALQAEKQHLDRQLASRSTPAQVPETPSRQASTTPATFQVATPASTGAPVWRAQAPTTEPPVTLPPVVDPPTTTPPTIPPTTTPPTTTPPATWVDDEGQQSGWDSQGTSDDSTQVTDGSSHDN